MKECKSVGSDEFHPKFLKETVFLIAKPLEIIFNKVLRKKTVSEIGKIGNVAPRNGQKKKSQTTDQ